MSHLTVKRVDILLNLLLTLFVFGSNLNVWTPNTGKFEQYKQESSC